MHQVYIEIQGVDIYIHYSLPSRASAVIICYFTPFVEFTNLELLKFQKYHTLMLYGLYFILQDKIRLIQDDLESEREIRQRVSQAIKNYKFIAQITISVD
jgi:hypothetical protein